MDPTVPSEVTPDRAGDLSQWEMSERHRRGFLCLLVAGFLFLTTVEAQPQRKISLSVGEAQVIRVVGTVQQIVLTASGGSSTAKVYAGLTLTAGDRVLTRSGSYVTLALADSSTIEIQPNTDFELMDFSGGIRELFQLWIGKVRVKIKHLMGAPNPYQMHSPIATIGVRGTEFDVIVEKNRVTTVRVFSGLVAVKHKQLRTDEMLVPAGNEVTLYPFRKPDSPVAFEQLVAENFIRESAVDKPLVSRFLAFPDAHLDVLENPAYASSLDKPSGRIYFFPARSEAFIRPEIASLSPLRQLTDVRGLFATDQRLMQGASARASYLRPIGEWVVGGLYEQRIYGQDFQFHISREMPSAFGGQVSVEQVGDSRFAPNLNLNSTARRTMFLGARRYRGNTFAVSYDWSRSTGDVDTTYEFRPNGYLLSSERTRSLFRTDSRKISFGYHLEDDMIGSLAFFYRVGFLSSETHQSKHTLDSSRAPLARFVDSGHTHEAGLRWRKRLRRNLALALVASLQRQNLSGSTSSFRLADSTGSNKFWVPSLGAGLGGKLGSRLFYAIDYQYSFVSESARRHDFADGSLTAFEKNRRHDHALHTWLQVHLPWSFFVGGGLTSFWASETFVGQYRIDSSGNRVDDHGRPQPESVFDLNSIQLNQLSTSVGRRFGDAFFIEYLASRTTGPQFSPTSHSLLLRIAF